LRVQLDARHRGFKRGGAEIEQARRARADNGETAFDVLLANIPVQHFPGRQIALLGLLGEPDPHLAVGLGRNLVVADADLDDAGLLAERLLAARAGRLDDVGRGALRQPQHIGGEGRVELVADLHHHGHAANDLIVLGKPIERAGARRLVLQLRQACGSAGIGRREQPRVVAAMRKSRLRLRQGAAFRGGDEAEHDGALADGLGEHVIVRGKLLDLCAQTGKRVGLRPEAQSICRRHAVRLGEDHVEADRGGTIVGERLHKLGEHRARPWPLSDPLQRLLVDVDDAQRKSWIEAARIDLLVGVEHHRAQARHRARVPDPQGERACNHGPYDEGVEETRTHRC
jgi:hypothetical protein